MVINKGSREHRIYQLVGYGLLAIAILVLPFILPEFQVTRFNRALAMAVAVLGLNLVVGYSGLLAICQSAFIAIGAFITGSLIQDEGWDYWMTIPIAMIGAFLVGVLLGFPALRIRGLYLAMVTLAFAAAFPGLTKLEFWGIAERTGGANGKEIEEKLNPPGWAESLGFSPEEAARYRYFPIVILAILAFWTVANLVKSRPGRAIISIRDNEIGAAVSGVNLPRFKVLNFGLSAAFGGLAGSMWAMNSGFVAEQDYTFILMIDLLVALVIGGVATIPGPFIGALVVVFVRWIAQTYIDIPLGFYRLDGNGPLSQAIFGIILILVVFFAPQGILGAWRKLWARVVQIRPVAPPVPEGLESISPSIDLTHDGSVAATT